MLIAAPVPVRAGLVAPQITEPTLGRQPRATLPIAGFRPTTSVRYVDTLPIRVRGAISGMQYEFSRAAPIQQVDARDSASLLRTRFFRRA